MEQIEFDVSGNVRLDGDGILRRCKPPFAIERIVHMIYYLVGKLVAIYIIMLMWKSIQYYNSSLFGVILKIYQQIPFPCFLHRLG